MKIKSVIKLCKRNRTAILYNQIDDNGEVVRQYIGDGASVFPLDGLPFAGKMLGEKIREVAATLTEPYEAEGDRVIGQLEFEKEDE